MLYHFLVEFFRMALVRATLVRTGTQPCSAKRQNKTQRVRPTFALREARTVARRARLLDQP